MKDQGNINKQGRVGEVSSRTRSVDDMGDLSIAQYSCWTTHLPSSIAKHEAARVRSTRIEVSVVNISLRNEALWIWEGLGVMQAGPVVHVSVPTSHHQIIVYPPAISKENGAFRDEVPVIHHIFRGEVRDAER